MQKRIPIYVTDQDTAIENAKKMLEYQGHKNVKVISSSPITLGYNIQLEFDEEYNNGLEKQKTKTISN